MPSLLTIAAAGALGALAAPEPDRGAGPIESTGVSGEYELTYFGKRLGAETFEIRPGDAGGWTVVATLEALGDQPSCRSEYRLDADRRFVSATFEPSAPDQLGATYRVAGTTLIATASDGQTQRITLGPDDLVAGPHYVTDFWVLCPLDLRVGESVSRTVHTFGFKDWRVYPSAVECRREKDRFTTRPNGRTKVRILRCTIEAGDETFKTGSWIDADGVSRRISIAAPIGSANVRLRTLSVTRGGAP